MWKRIPVILLLWLLSTIPAVAQCQGYCLHLPLIHSFNPCGVQAMSDWKILTPDSTLNRVLNPSAETTLNFAALAGTTVTRVTTFQHYGLNSYRVESNADNEGATFTLSALANAIHYVTVRVRGTLPASWDWSLDNATYTVPTLLEAIDSTWSLYGIQFPAAQASASVLLYIRQNGAGSGDFYLDGIQVEEKSYYTTYCDGTQPGCEWNGPENASTSQRSASSRAGGRVQDLQDDYYLNIGGMSGTGTPAQALGLDSYAILPGGEMNNIKINSRVFTLTGVITGTSQSDFHSKKQTLLNALSPDTYPEDADGPQPVQLRYNGATVHKQIAAFYEGGLEGEISASDPCAWERVAVRFISPNPYWTEIGESAASLDTNDSATFRYVAARLRSTGQWSALGPPGAGGTYTAIYTLAEDATYVYIGGDFTNFDGIAAADRIVRYNKQTGVYSAMGTGANGVVEEIIAGPDGSIYAAGSFTLAGGVANTVGIARWDGTAWNALTTGVSGGAVFALAFGPDGVLYVGGSFTLAGGVANTVRIAAWSGTAWSALSTGASSSVFALAVSSSNVLYAGGAFTTIGGVSANRIASWNGSAFSAMGTGMPANVESLILSSDILYAGGAFTTAGGTTVNYIASWNGTVFSALGSGMSNFVWSMSAGQDGILYAGGIFTSAGGIAVADSIARWNGSAWAHVDTTLPGAATVYAILASKYVDPVVEQQYNLWLGFDTTGTGNFAGKTAVVNEGNAPAFPKIIYNRSAGTTAIIETLRNERDGSELLFNYGLLSTETLTIDLTPTKKSIVSSFFGLRQDAILANSDFGTWSLLPGSNDITSFVATSGSPTVTSYLLYKDSYKSQD